MPFFSVNCNSHARLDGKIAVITGCNTGIGKETAMDFYKRGARVVMACRNMEKTEMAKKEIIEKCKDVTNVGELVVTKLDLNSLKSVRECAQHLLDTEKQINILVNNAGVYSFQGKSEDGFEIQFATNHLAHYLFTLLLLPRIRNSTPARVVTVSSVGHKYAEIDFEDPNFGKNVKERAGKGYVLSKLANILFSKELANRLKERNITGINTYSLHPGVIASELGRDMDSAMFRGASWLWFNFFSWFFKTPWLGAQTTIYCALDEKCANETGLYYSECSAVEPSEAAQSAENAKRLWEESARMVQLGDFNPFTAHDPGVKISFDKKSSI